ncbi:MAG: hypothetical protein E7618_08025 [Ruminococcaceae bacterium]|nr:hypothetical protein [Oscillospiraceae bacterium]
MIAWTSYKDRPAVAVKAGSLTALFLPEDGGKMASLTDEQGFEYLAQAKGEVYQRLTPDGEFIHSECSSFDDMFPTIDPYTADKGAFAGIPYPDHGEICRLPWEVQMGKQEVTFVCRSRLFKTVFSKTVCAENGALAVHYRIENGYDEPYPYLWAAHCMLAGEEGAVVTTAYAEDAPIRKMFGRQEAAEMKRDALVVHDPVDGLAYKFYYTEPIPRGEVAYHYPSTGRTIRFDYDADKIPWLGVWINNGSFKGMYNIALEIATAPYDSPAEAMKANACSYLPAGGAVTFTLRFSVVEA